MIYNKCKSADCDRCKGTGYHGLWGDSDYDDDSRRRCNNCDFHVTDHDRKKWAWQYAAAAISKLDPRYIEEMMCFSDQLHEALTELQRLGEVQTR